MPDLSVMILCGRSPRHWYVANRLCEAARPVAIVQEVGGERVGRKLLKLLAHPADLGAKVWRWVRDRRRYVGGAEGRFFFGDGPPCLTRKDLVVEVPHINHPDVVALAKRLGPDVIAVFGTSLIKGALLSLGRLGVVNLHGGLSPEYRGADCTFWALHNRQPEQVGCTLHAIDPGVDTGNLIAHVCPEVREGDDELTLFWRGVRDSAEVYGQFLRRLAAGERFGRPQSDPGHQYRVRDRKWRHERELAAAMAEGLLRGVQLPPRVTWYMAEGAPSVAQQR